MFLLIKNYLDFKSINPSIKYLLIYYITIVDYVLYINSSSSSEKLEPLLSNLLGAAGGTAAAATAAGVLSYGISDIL